MVGLHYISKRCFCSRIFRVILETNSLISVAVLRPHSCKRIDRMRWGSLLPNRISLTTGSSIGLRYTSNGQKKAIPRHVWQGAEKQTNNLSTYMTHPNNTAKELQLLPLKVKIKIILSFRVILVLFTYNYIIYSFYFYIFHFSHTLF